MKKEDRIRIISRVMGSALTPPNHPSQNWCVEFDLHRKPENRGTMSLMYALENCKRLTKEQKNQIKNKLDSWDKLPLTHFLVHNWIKKCQKHWEGLESLGIKYIQKYYPEYQRKRI